MKIEKATIRNLNAYSHNGSFIPEGELSTYIGGLLLIPKTKGYIKWFAGWEQVGRFLRETEENNLDTFL